MSERFDESILNLHEALMSGELTSVDLTKRTLERIKALDSKYNAFITLDEEGALKAAEASDALGYSDDRPLQGIPLGIKDNIVTKGVKTTAASKILSNFVPVYSATAVEKLEAAGAILIGKLNLDEFAMGGSNETSYYGPVHNPWDLDRVPGGSSGGSAAAVAGGEVVGTLGTDTGGSIRQPAAFNGIVGMKPSYGRVSRYGLIAFGSSLDQIGPLTRTVYDNALMLEAIAGHDHRDLTSSPNPVPSYTEKIKDGIAGMKIAVPKEFMGTGLNPEVKAGIEAAIKELENLGASVHEVSLPHMKYGVATYYVIGSSEASSNLQRFDGVRYGYRAEDVKDMEDLYTKTRSEGFGNEVKMRIMLGTFSLSSGHYDAYFKKARQVRQVIKEEFDSIFKEYDLIVTPTTNTCAYKIGEKIDDPVEMYMGDLLTIPVNLAGLPAISVPAGYNSEGLPIGLQLIGPYEAEATLYRAAYAYEQATKHNMRTPE